VHITSLNADVKATNNIILSTSAGGKECTVEIYNVFSFKYNVIFDLCIFMMAFQNLCFRVHLHAYFLENKLGLYTF
jgi:hypothetical protein